MQAPLVADLKRNALDDGPGIRTTVFFKGCPLSCAWCHNPEAISHEAELLFRPKSCIDCKGCATACPVDAIGAAGPSELDRDLCDACGLCADECPTGALERVGVRYEVEELTTLLLRDRAFFESSGGGVTLSGGEPALYSEFVGALAAALHAEGVHTLIQTSGDFGWSAFEEHLLPYLDEVYVDLKLLSPERHQNYCGRDNARIHANIRRLAQAKVELLVRIPLIPGITATEANLRAARAFLEELGHTRVGVIPYNPLWMTKARGLGRPLRFERQAWLGEEERELCRAALRGLEVVGDL
jgi:pyruvate formate lyase activating enzyme